MANDLIPGNFLYRRVAKITTEHAKDIMDFNIIENEYVLCDLSAFLVYFAVISLFTAEARRSTLRAQKKLCIKM